MDIGHLPKEEVEELMRLVNDRLNQIRVDERGMQDARTGRIEDSIAALDDLLGPVDAVAGTGSIRAVRKFDGQTMADNASIALPLAFHGLEILTATVRDIASTIAAK